MQWSLFFKLANLAWEFFPVWPKHLLKDNLTAEGAMVEEQVEENHKHSLWNLYYGRPIFKGNKICSRKNSVHIIFVSVPSVERTLLFRRYRHFLGVPKPGFNLQLGYTFVLKTWPTQRGLITGPWLISLSYTVAYLTCTEDAALPPSWVSEVIKNKVGLFRRYVLTLKSFKLRFKKWLSKECD